MDTLTGFVTTILAISIASERMVEVLKGWFPDSTLFKSETDPTKEAHRCAWIHLLAGLCGGFAAAVGHIDILKTLSSGWQNPGHGPMHYVYWVLSCSVSGILASGGSAFWNHALDLIKASKVKQEQGAITAVATNNRDNLLDAAHPTSFALAMEAPGGPVVQHPLLSGGETGVGCLMSLDPTPGSTKILAKPGTLRFKLVSKGGTFDFVPGACSVKDSSNNTVAFSPPATASELAFPVTDGAYKLTTTYLIQGDASADLIEDCSAKTVLWSLDKSNASLIFTILVSS